MNEETSDPAKRLEIKKYANRRYYDATHSRHLTLEEIRDLIQRGYDIRVTDGSTGNDITAQVLIQLILELDTPKLDALPIPLLVRLIRINDPLIKDFIEKYFNQALKSFFDYQQQAEEQLRRIHGLPPVFPSVSAWTKAMFEPFASAFTPQPPPSSPPPSTPPPAGTENQELWQIIRELQQELAELKRSRQTPPPTSQEPASKKPRRGRK